MAHSISVYSEEDIRTGNADLNAYYALRKESFREKFNSTAFDTYPDGYDQRAGTRILIFKAPDPATGEPVVFGGVRLVFPYRNSIGSLPAETKHTAHTDSLALRKFTSLHQNPRLDITHILPAIGAGVPVHYAELGGFAVDDATMHRLFDTRTRYATLNALMAQECLDIARDLGVDILISGNHQKNLQHLKDRLTEGKSYEFRQLGALKHLFTNPFPPGQEAQLLLINLSGRYPLHGENSILRPIHPGSRAR